MPSGKPDSPIDPIILQESHEQYDTWAKVEAHYQEENIEPEQKQIEQQPAKEQKADKDLASNRLSNGSLSQTLLDRLNFGPQPAASPGSTPPMSPSQSEPQSSQTSPEVKTAHMTTAERSPVPHALQALLNPVVWYIHEKSGGQTNVFFLTNSADTQHLARDFKVPTKTIHQLRSALGADSLHPERNHQRQRSASSQPDTAEGEPKTLFSYEDESEEEEVVFQPKGRGTRAPASRRGGPHGSVRGRGSIRSPRLSFSSISQTPANKPQIPIEEIDPNSFDRGSFGRGSVPLANTAPVGNHTPNQFSGFPRGPSNRAGYTPAGPSRANHRGGGRGMDRGSARGRGRLFVP